MPLRWSDGRHRIRDELNKRWGHLSHLLEQIRQQKQANAERAQRERDRREATRKAVFVPKLPWGLPWSFEAASDGGREDAEDDDGGSAMPAHTVQSSLFLYYWDVITACGCLYLAIAIPYSLAFDEFHFGAHTGQCGFPKDLPTMLRLTRAMDIVVDVLFVCDVFVNFQTAVWQLNNEPMLHWVLIDNLHEVHKRYVWQGSFWLDVVSCVPVQYIDCIPGVDSVELKLVRLVRLLKLARLTRLSDLIDWLKSHVPGSDYVITFMELGLYFFLFSHWVACLFFAIAYGYGDPNGTEYQRFLFLRGWVHKDGLSTQDPACSRLPRTSFRFVVMTWCKVMLVQVS